MDPNGRIYESEKPPPEDVARLDGYLRGRAEEDAAAELERVKAELERLEAEQVAEQRPGGLADRL